MSMTTGNTKILVTGAGGLVGFHTCQHLVRDNYSVVALLRKSSNTGVLVPPGTNDQTVRTSKTSRESALAALSRFGNLRICWANLFEQEHLAEIMSGCAVVVHAAGVVNPYGSRQEIYQTNVMGTRAVLEAAIAAKVRQFIYISSLSVITGQGDQFRVNEKAPVRYCGEAYADSKIDAETLVMKTGLGGSIAVTSLRPGFIYGPGERSWMPRLIESIDSGKAMLIDGGTKETNVIYVENLCKALTGAILNSQAFGRVYNLTDGQMITKRELFNSISDGLGLPRVEREIPGFVARPFSELISTIAPCLPVSWQRKLARYSRAAYRLAGVNQGFDISRAEQDLAYTDRIPFSEGMATTLEHFKRARCATDSSPVTGQAHSTRTL